MLGRQPRGSTRQIQLDDFGGAGTHQKQQFDLWSTGQQLAHNPVEFGVGIGQAGQIPLINDGRGKARFGKNHDAGGRLDQMGAGARTHDQKKRILNFAVQPDDAREAAEHLMLSTFAQHRRITAAACGIHGNWKTHGAHAEANVGALDPASTCCRAS